ncbi:MAG: 50S ribosomal protein L10 [Desulfurococcales archaeon]|nr:50S ribosomal protein L10 [Desulfurococcales archaeon]
MKGSTKAGMLKLLEKLSREGKIQKSRVRPAITKKQAVVEELKKLIQSYNTIGLIDLTDVPTPQYKQIKRELERYGLIKVYKNSLFLRAAKEVGLKNLDKLEPYLTGTNAFIFTNINAYELVLMLEKHTALRYAKPGDKATDDIYLPQGPTGIQPGPMLSVFGKLKVPTQVREGIIWIAKDTRVARAGDEISPELSSLLRKLDIRPIHVKLRLKVVWDNGLVLPSEKLVVNIEEFKNDILSAVSVAKELAAETALPLPDILPDAIMRAHLRAVALVSEIGLLTPETAEIIIRSAVSKALALAASLAGKVPDLGLGVKLLSQPPQPQAAPAEEKEEEEEEKEEVSEEEIAEGISSLFG